MENYNSMIPDSEPFQEATGGLKAHLLTVYPRSYKEDVSALVLSDYHHTLAKIGFDTRHRGEIYLQNSRKWLSYDHPFPFPILGGNKFLFIHSHGTFTASPDDVLDSLFA